MILSVDNMLSMSSDLNIHDDWIYVVICPVRISFRCRELHDPSETCNVCSGWDDIMSTYKPAILTCLLLKDNIIEKNEYHGEDVPSCIYTARCFEVYLGSISILPLVILRNNFATGYIYENYTNISSILHRTIDMKDMLKHSDYENGISYLVPMREEQEKFERELINYNKEDIVIVLEISRE